MKKIHVKRSKINNGIKKASNREAHFLKVTVHKDFKSQCFIVILILHRLYLFNSKHQRWYNNMENILN